MESFAKHFGRSPDQLGPEQIRAYQVYLLKERKLGARTVGHHTAALRFFFCRTLKRAYTVEDVPYPKKGKSLPIILTQEEAIRLIDSASNLFHRAMLMTIYSNPPSFDHYDALAHSLAAAYTTGDKDAVREINWTSATSFVWDHEPTDRQRRLPTWFASSTRDTALALADARRIVAHARGFDSWDAFLASTAAPTADPRSAPVFLSSTPPFYKIDWNENRVYVNGPQSARDWDTILAVIHEHAIPKLSAAGITDAVMARLSSRR